MQISNESFTNSTTTVVYSSATEEKKYQLFVTSEDLTYSAFTTKIANVLDDIPANLNFSYYDVATNREFELHKLSIIAEIVNKKFDFRVKRRSVNTTTRSNLPASYLVISNWLCSYQCRRHDFFISYRSWCEISVAKELASHIRNETIVSDINPIHSFLDIDCLTPALEGLMKDGEIEDDMLLEVTYQTFEQWELALNMHQRGLVEILPLLVAEEKTEYINGSYEKQKLIKPFVFNISLPDRVHSHPLSPKTHTIRETINKLFEIQAGHLYPDDIRSAAIMIFSYPKMKLSAWLKPLDKEMRLERDQLLSAHVRGTRSWLLVKILDFVNQKSTSKDDRVLWLCGSDGVGKSVSAALVAKELQMRNMLGATFFAKHNDNSRNNARKLIATIAYMLTEWNRTFGVMLLDICNKNNDILTKPLPEMFESLIQIPLQNLAEAENPPTVVIVVDALDECGNLRFRNDILDIFATKCLQLPPFVKLVITSRPEDDIIVAFKLIKPTILEQTGNENIEDALISVRHFLNTHNATPECVKEGPQILVDKSKGLFLWLVQACKSLGRNSEGKITLEVVNNLPDVMGSIEKISVNDYSSLNFNNLIPADSNIQTIHLPISSDNDLPNLLESQLDNDDKLEIRNHQNSPVYSNENEIDSKEYPQEQCVPFEGIGNAFQIITRILVTILSAVMVYRQGEKDSKFAKTLAEFLNAGKHRSYLDQNCMEYGKDWKKSFISGLFNSRTIVILMSEEAVLRLISKKGNEKMKNDHMFLEWAISMELSKFSKIKIYTVWIENFGNSEAKYFSTVNPLEEEFCFQTPLSNAKSCEIARGTNVSRDENSIEKLAKKILEFAKKTESVTISSLVERFKDFEKIKIWLNQNDPATQEEPTNITWKNLDKSIRTILQNEGPICTVTQCELESEKMKNTPFFVICLQWPSERFTKVRIAYHPKSRSVHCSGRNAGSSTNEMWNHGCQTFKVKDASGTNPDEWKCTSLKYPDNYSHINFDYATVKVMEGPPEKSIVFELHYTKETNTDVGVLIWNPLETLRSKPALYFPFKISEENLFDSARWSFNKKTRTWVIAVLQKEKSPEVSTLTKSKFLLTIWTKTDSHEEWSSEVGGSNSFEAFSMRIVDVNPDLIVVLAKYNVQNPTEIDVENVFIWFDQNEHEVSTSGRLTGCSISDTYLILVYDQPSIVSIWNIHNLLNEFQFDSKSDLIWNSEVLSKPNWWKNDTLIVSVGISSNSRFLAFLAHPSDGVDSVILYDHKPLTEKSNFNEWGRCKAYEWTVDKRNDGDFVYLIHGVSECDYDSDFKILDEKFFVTEVKV
ncbi:hypothetical protein HK096_007843 [Nowakowskiella sp. JEL0078]|nr:hypothetical protein HK096_007843 [Nowakowskiella sp. JEL0078]